MQSKNSNHYLYFSKRERRGILILFLLIGLIYISPSVYSKLYPIKTLTDLEVYDLKAITKTKKDSVDYKFKEEGKSIALFNFDPNTISTEGWKSLGVKEKTALGIQKYISKGGKFKNPEDIKKIWGIPPEKAEELIPFIKINLPEQKQTSFVKHDYYKQDYIKHDYKKTIKPIDINAADSAAFESLPGIGPKLSQRIINFRERLGGFYKIEQISETFGLPDTTFQKIKPYLIFSQYSVKKININTATLQDLKAHPYIRYQIANAIINYRSQHGDFKSLSETRKIILITDEVYDKVYSYLEL